MSNRLVNIKKSNKSVKLKDLVGAKQATMLKTIFISFIILNVIGHLILEESIYDKVNARYLKSKEADIMALNDSNMAKIYENVSFITHNIGLAALRSTSYINADANPLSFQESYETMDYNGAMINKGLDEPLFYIPKSINQKIWFEKIRRTKYRDHLLMSIANDRNKFTHSVFDVSLKSVMMKWVPRESFLELVNSRGDYKYCKDYAFCKYAKKPKIRFEKTIDIANENDKVDIAIVPPYYDINNQKTMVTFLSTTKRMKKGKLKTVGLYGANIEVSKFFKDMQKINDLHQMSFIVGKGGMMLADKKDVIELLDIKDHINDIKLTKEFFNIKDNKYLTEYFKKLEKSGKIQEARQDEIAIKGKTYVITKSSSQNGFTLYNLINKEEMINLFDDANQFIRNYLYMLSIFMFILLAALYSVFKASMKKDIIQSLDELDKLIFSLKNYGDLSKEEKSKFHSSMINEIQNIYGVYENLNKLNKEIIETQKESLITIGEAVEARSKETGLHVKRVAEYSKLLGEKLGLSKKEIQLISLASPMHDVGKIAVPDYILNKPGRLTQEEFEVMKKHATEGEKMLKINDKEIFKTSSIIAGQHHERWDGRGYPRGLEGEKIHIFGRITAIADVFDAVGSDRVYKKAWELDKILVLLKEEKGKHFDPNLIDIFFDNLGEFLAIRDKYSDNFQRVTDTEELIK